MLKNMPRKALNLLLSLLFVGSVLSTPLTAADGKAVFKANCAVCHTLTDQKLTGPGLKGIADRAPKGDWLFNWIKNSDKMIKSGDAYGVKLFNDNGKQAMTVFEGVLSDDDINAVVEYIKNPPVEVAAVKTDSGTNAGAETAANEEKGISPLYILLTLIVILAILISILRGIRVSMQNIANKIEGKEEVPAVSFWQEAREWVAGHRRIVGVFTIIILFIGMKGCWNSLFNMGVYYDYRTQKGYKPEQPIKFSHKLHAGDNGIACQYCHNSVEKSRHSGIPSVNVCMNCHKGISTGPQYGETEIAKIYAAAGFDPKSGTYDQSKANPIKWVKVHNLPDHVYFNHSQHFVVGKIDCAVCHGDVKSMTVAEQKSPLTMKWCIECHRKTEVAMEGNSYYEKLHNNLKEMYKDQKLKKFTVAQMGGLECGKCHY